MYIKMPNQNGQYSNFSAALYIVAKNTTRMEAFKNENFENCLRCANL